MNGVKLNKEKGNFIKVLDMQDGQIAEIVKHYEKRYLGRIVQRNAKDLISIGYNKYHTWFNLFNTTDTISCEVRILEKGDTITIL